MTTITELDDYNFSEFVATYKVAIIDFNADWCGPCKRMKPIFEKFSKEFPKIAFGSVNVDHAPETAMRFSIQSIPLFILFKDGKPLKSVLGSAPAELKELLKSVV